MPAVGFGTLIPDLAKTKDATKTALEVGFRHFDCAERYRNEEAVGDAMRTTTPDWRQAITDRLDMPADGIWKDADHLGHY